MLNYLVAKIVELIYNINGYVVSIVNITFAKNVAQVKRKNRILKKKINFFCIADVIINLRNVTASSKEDITKIERTLIPMNFRIGGLDYSFHHLIQTIVVTYVEMTST
jgi:hypothetical protein